MSPGTPPVTSSSRIPQEAAGFRQNLDLTRAAWKQAAATPEGRQGMAMACKQATETAKTVMQAYGCTW